MCDAGNDDLLEGLTDLDWDGDWSNYGEPTSSSPDDYEPAPLAESKVKRLVEILTESEEPEATETSSVVRSTRSASRFPKRINDGDIEKAVRNRVPKNTVKSMNWGVRVFEEWCNERDIRESLTDMTDTQLNSYISHFVHEAVKKDGLPYPPNSLYQLVVSIQRYLKENGRHEVLFFDQPVYDTLRKSLDARMKELTADGYGIGKKCAEPITRDMERVLWEKGVFCRNSAVGLLNVVYFYNCKLFGLRAGDEHRGLNVEQFRFGKDEDEYLEFIGNVSKTYNGGLQHRKILPKKLKIYADPELGDTDIVSIFKYYLSLVPKEGAFYRRPAIKASSVAFTKQVVGKNTLSKLAQNFCSEAGLEGHFTGHSGKVTCATELFHNGVDEQLIQIYTGHRSVAGVRSYKRPGEDQYKAISKILQPPPMKKSEVENIDPCSKSLIEPQNSANVMVKAAMSTGTFNASNGNITFNFNLKQ